MKTIALFKKSLYIVPMAAVCLTFAQCGGSDNYKENPEVQSQNSGNNEQESMYPDEKLQQNTNLETNDPFENSPEGLDKNVLLATLNQQKTLVKYRIEELERSPGNNSDASTLEGNTQQLKVYMEKLDQEITNVRNATKDNIKQVSETAQGAIKGAGALMESPRMQVYQGY